MFDEIERKNKEKAFDICKAALIKAVVEVFAEEKNEEILWKNNDTEQPGGLFVNRFVQWIKGYVEAQETKDAAKVIENGRDDMAICASLSLGNLIRKGEAQYKLYIPTFTDFLFSSTRHSTLIQALFIWPNSLFQLFLLLFDGH